MHIAKYIPTGKLIDISNVVKGKKCNCKCYSCGGKLIAKKGEQRADHFAHDKNSEKECQYSFWVVCRDLAKQIFLNTEKNAPIKISLNNNIEYVQVADISTYNAKVENINFDLYFHTKKYGIIYVYFLTPETQRLQINQHDTYPCTILLINISEAENKKDKIIELLNKIIFQSVDKKHLILQNSNIPIKQKPIRNKHPYISLFGEIEEEEKERIRQEEIINNTPKLNEYTSHNFIEELSLFSAEIGLRDLNVDDISNIEKLASVYISFMQKYGHKDNKSLIYKEIAKSGDNFELISMKEMFFGILQTHKNTYIVYYAREHTLSPIFVVSFRSSVKNKISYWFSRRTS